MMRVCILEQIGWRFWVVIFQLIRTGVLMFYLQAVVYHERIVERSRVQGCIIFMHWEAEGGKKQAPCFSQGL